MELVGNIINHDHNLSVLKTSFIKFYICSSLTQNNNLSFDKMLDSYLEDNYQKYVENNRFLLDDYDLVYIGFVLASIQNYDLLSSLKIDKKVLSAFRVFTDYMVKNWYHLFKHPSSTSDRDDVSSKEEGSLYA